MAKITGGELLVKCLQKEGVKRIIGITDASYQPVMFSCGKYNIRWIAPRHEAAGAHMAEGIYKSSGEIPVVMAGAGPGMANLVSGIICARSEGVPIIAITGARRKEVIYPAKTGVYQGMDQLEIFRPITKWNAVVHDLERLPEIIQMAFREAVAGRPGPVHVDISDTILYEEIDDSKITLLEPHQYRAVNPPVPSEMDLDDIAKLISRSKNPLLIAGTGVLNSEGTQVFIELIELLNCPATTTMAARSALPNDHPNLIFGYSNGAFAARREADVVLAFGTCLGELDLPFAKYWGDINTQKIIQVDIDPRNIGANWPIFKGVVGDAKATLKALLNRLKTMGVEPSEGVHLKHYKEMEQEWFKTERQPIDEYVGEKIHPARSVEIAREVFGPDAINVGDGGNTSLYNGFFTTFTKPRTSLGIFEFGHLGTGIPYAVGAKLANPNQDVYCITGDGAAGFNFMELATALREKAKITVIVHAEESWCMEEIIQLTVVDNPAKTIATTQLPIRWDKIAEAIGCYSEYVERLDELQAAITRAKESELPAVVCVKTDKQSNLIPPGAEQFEEVYSGSLDEQ